MKTPVKIIDTKSERGIHLIISVASGKGGTGKTTVAVNLALSIENIQLLDCDVEEPNAHLFLNPQINKVRSVHIPLPKINENLCDYCRKCSEFCEFHAIIVISNKIMVFPELCHGCGGCMRFCPGKVITEEGREVGSVETGRAKGFRFAHGKLKIGEVMSPPLIKAVQQAAVESEVTIIDAPPGTSCPVIEAVRHSDFIILVTEPTPFGLNDLKLAVDMVRVIAVPFAVAINRSDIGDEAVRQYCRKEQIDIILEIPNDRRVAEAYSRGELAGECFADYENTFSKLSHTLLDRTAGLTASK